MKITKITYSKTKNLGNYQSARLELTSDVNETENWEDILDSLKEEVENKLKNERS